MLLNLHVKNLALIKDIDVDFKNGLIVLTGETGAGKSLLLGSINLALGNKASKDVIRTGTDYSLVELTFLVNDNIAKQIMDKDIFVEDNIVTVTRKLSEGRSVAKINGETVNLQILKEIMGMLVDIHGQHEHQSLLYANKHLEILDKFAKSDVEDLLIEIKEKYNHYISLKHQLNNMDIDESVRAREIEFAAFEINEIESANLKSGEDVLLEEEYKKASNSKEIVSVLSGIYNTLGYDYNGAGDLINRAVLDVNRIKHLDSNIEDFSQLLYDMDSLCRDLTSQLTEYNRNLEYDPEAVLNMEERLNVINRLKLKYGQNIEQILAYKEEKQEYLNKLNNARFEIDKIKHEIDSVSNLLTDLCSQLTQKRKVAACELEKKVISALTDLNFETIDFQIKIEPTDKITINGMDKIEFLISTNPGEAVKPLGKVASGGELSRIMLAIKSILAGEDEIETMIFDEIDTGISGITAQKVANKLAKISKSHQVICISHLAQIAAMADNHYLIEKHSEDNSTVTNIFELNREQSINELVRISGGMEVTQAAINHAIEMKDMADRTKCNLI